MQDTLEVLKDAGCTEEARRAFVKAVERYNDAKFPFDYRSFPASSNGFYSFDSPSRLLSALPRKLSDIEHAKDLNCFDAAILLGAGQLQTGVSNQSCGPFFVVYESTPGIMVTTLKRTETEAFDLLYPKEYQEQTRDLFPQSLHNARTTLNAALFQLHYFAATNEQALRDDLMRILRMRWASCAIKFPVRFELVLGHHVDLPNGYAVTAHAGLLFPRKKGYVYPEKSAVSGPFVRLDIEDKEDLCVWFRGSFKGAPKSGWTHHFATFNDTEIRAFTVSE